MINNIRKYTSAAIMVIAVFILAVTNVCFVLSLFKYGSQHIEYSKDMIGYIMQDVIGLIVYFIGRIFYRD